MGLTCYSNSKCDTENRWTLGSSEQRSYLWQLPAKVLNVPLAELLFFLNILTNKSRVVYVPPRYTAENCLVVPVIMISKRLSCYLTTISKQLFCYTYNDISTSTLLYLLSSTSFLFIRCCRASSILGISLYRSLLLGIQSKCLNSILTYNICVYSSIGIINTSLRMWK